MAIQGVDIDKALTNEQYAGQVIRSGKCSAEERLQLAIKWGNEKIAKWESVDSTQYEIDDTQKAEARAEGDKKVDEATNGFDGKSDGTKSAVGAAMAGVGGVAGAGAGAISMLTTTIMGTSNKAAHARASAFIAAAVGLILVGLSKALKAMDPNKEQAQACDDMAPVLENANGELNGLGKEVSETTNNITDDTDALIDVDKESEDTQKSEEEQYKRMLDRQQVLLDKLEASTKGGEPFTSEDKAELDALSVALGIKYGEIKNISEAGNKEKEKLTENIESSQETYDSLGEKIEEVHEMTEFQAGFDKDTVDNTKLVKGAAKVGLVGSAGVAVGGLKGLMQWGNWAAMAAGAVALGEAYISADTFSDVIKDQNEYLSKARAGVDNRHATEDINDQTTETYEEDLDTYASNIEANDEIIFEETKYTEPTTIDLSGGDGDNPPEVNPPAGDSGNNPFANPDKKEEDEV